MICSYPITIGGIVLYQSQLKNFENHSYVDLYPIQFGYATCPPSHAYGPFSRLNYLFHYIIQGKGEVSFTDDKHIFKLKSGQGFLIPPNVRAAYKADTNDPWKYCWIEFNGVKAKTILHQAGLDENSRIYQPLKLEANEKIYQQIYQITDDITGSEMKILSHMYQFFDQLIKHSAQSKEIYHSPIYSTYMRKAMNYIKHRFQENITIEDLAEFLHINTYHLNRLFKRELGLTPHQFLINYRLTYAKNLMTQNKIPLKEIALQSGFTNQYYFSTAFKKNTGVSPSQWLKQEHKSYEQE